MNNYEYINTDLLARIKEDSKDANDSVLRLTLSDYFNKRITSLSSFDLKALQDFPKYFKSDFETYLMVPMILFIIKEYSLGFIQNNQNKLIK